MKNKVEEFKEHLPLVQTLFNPGLRSRHWEQISELIGFPLAPDDDMCLSKLIDMNIESFIPKFEGISEAASKEYSLEKAMEKMKQEWDPVCFLYSRTIVLESLNSYFQVLTRKYSYFWIFFIGQILKLSKYII